MAPKFDRAVIHQDELMKAPRALWVSTSLSTRGGVATLVRNMRSTKLWQDWNIRHVATHCNGSALTRIIKFAVGFCKFVGELVVRRPGIVHIHTSTSGSFVRKFIVMWAAEAFRIPVVMHVHGGGFHDFFYDAPRPVRFLIRNTLEHADAVIALGNTWATELQRIAPRADVVVVDNAIRPNGAVQMEGPGPVSVIFLGDVIEAKGIFVLLAAWAKLIAQHGGYQARLTIAGDGDLSRARRLIAEMAIEASVDLRGWISPTEVSALLMNAQVLVLPSQTEGQPMAILEGMSRGLCIVATNVGGIPDMLGESGGVIVDPGNVDALASALNYVLTDGDARTRYGANALRRVEDQFNVDTASQRIDNLYRLILGRRNA